MAGVLRSGLALLEGGDIAVKATCIVGGLGSGLALLSSGDVALEATLRTSARRSQNQRDIICWRCRKTW
jgi:hypothetical protein